MTIRICRNGGGHDYGWYGRDTDGTRLFEYSTRQGCLEELDIDACRDRIIIIDAIDPGGGPLEVARTRVGTWIVRTVAGKEEYHSVNRAAALIWAESYTNGRVRCEAEPYRGIGPEPASRDQRDPDVEPETGVKFDGEKVRAALLPGKALRLVAEVLTFGAQKYGDNNWRKMKDLGRYRHAMVRHLLAVLEGEDVDPESGKRHMAHIATNALFLLELED